MGRNARAEVLFRSAVLAAGALVIVSAAGCKKKPPAPAPAPPAESAPVTPAPSIPQEEVREDPIRPIVEPRDQEADIDDLIRRQNQGREFLRTVYFDFDRAEIREDQAAILQANAAWLKAHPQYRLLLEGHADERDTIEYNLALGDRRARSVISYLADLGVPTALVRTISYGEERPANPGHDEESWGLNRRAEFVLER